MDRELYILNKTAGNVVSGTYGRTYLKWYGLGGIKSFYDPNSTKEYFVYDNANIAFGSVVILERSIELLLDKSMLEIWNHVEVANKTLSFHVKCNCYKKETKEEEEAGNHVKAGIKLTSRQSIFKLLILLKIIMDLIVKCFEHGHLTSDQLYQLSLLLVVTSELTLQLKDRFNKKDLYTLMRKACSKYNKFIQYHMHTAALTEALIEDPDYLNPPEEPCSICITQHIDNDCDFAVLTCPHRFCIPCATQWFQEK